MDVIFLIAGIVKVRFPTCEEEFKAIESTEETVWHSAVNQSPFLPTGSHSG